MYIRIEGNSRGGEDPMFVVDMGIIHENLTHKKFVQCKIGLPAPINIVYCKKIEDRLCNSVKI